MSRLSTLQTLKKNSRPYLFEDFGAKVYQLLLRNDIDPDIIPVSSACEYIDNMIEHAPNSKEWCWDE
ncbi:hypothetical protein NVP1238A_09 [Vibrio phage 1.238.A._10N.261.52.F10]|uniref:Uncharacterized protein n=2 Tax=Pariacacavirus TaxID=2948856 RepID=A0A2I7RUC4_9CAUD|nr:hypothetical protein KNT79_gp09 [Vibrio phage 1.238.A._10N.261.52.F10]YP_010093455.1 hypothetical protein KNT80_gp12 [Vibrio phage 1.245.O._10N.261.54.C7]AUR97258.1 hypothetical protein NVP1238A_09 [Vibrio phage 1.238.A._10N.261.52.F10]AUR97352.1 hypothetical protein NVP1238B_10 [Vibrio phage 1.238.B._10N.261.52.F10]AUR97925.1 hypothetical protein NVP1245O_12 [Vibrio phage 1.245.O._10N.261.54.C7]